MKYAFVAIVKVADRRNYPSHGEFRHGAYKIVSECDTILTAETIRDNFALTRPLPDGEVYEAFHQMDGRPRL